MIIEDDEFHSIKLPPDPIDHYLMIRQQLRRVATLIDMAIDAMTIDECGNILEDKEIRSFLVQPSDVLIAIIKELSIDDNKTA